MIVTIPGLERNGKTLHWTEEIQTGAMAMAKTTAKAASYTSPVSGAVTPELWRVPTQPL
jgi:hypothetical protein